MAIETQDFNVEYVGNGSTTTAYPIPFTFLENSHINLFVDDKEVGASQISVIGAKNSSGGELRTAVAYSSRQKIRISRLVPFTQPFRYEEGDSLPAKNLETNFDLLEMQIQQLAQFDLSALQEALNLLKVSQVQEETEDFLIGPAHMNALVRVNSSNPVTITLPEESGLDVAFFCVISRVGDGSVELVGQGNVVVDTEAFRVFGKYTAVAVHYVAEDRYQIYGDLY